MPRNIADRKRWVLIDAAVGGHDGLFIAPQVYEQQVEINRFLKLCEEEGIKVSRTVRKDGLIELMSGGRIFLKPGREIGQTCRGMKLAYIVSTVVLSYWDRRDLAATGGTFV